MPPHSSLMWSTGTPNISFMSPTGMPKPMLTASSRRDDVHDRDLVGPDAAVGVDTIRSGVVSDAVAVELSERVVTAIEAGRKSAKTPPRGST